MVILILTVRMLVLVIVILVILIRTVRMLVLVIVIKTRTDTIHQSVASTWNILSYSLHSAGSPETARDRR